MSEKLTQEESLAHAQGSEYAALCLEAMLLGQEAPVPPFQLITEVAGTLVVRNVAEGDISLRPTDNPYASEDHIGSQYRHEIRDLREAQHEVSEGSYSPLSKIEEYTGTSLGEHCFSPSAVSMVAGWIDGSGYNTTRCLSKRAATEAILSPEGFLAAVDKIGREEPRVLIGNIGTLSNFVPSEEIREWIDAVSTSRHQRDGSAFLNNLSKVTDYFEDEPDVLAERVKSALNSAYPTTALDMLTGRATILQYLTPAEARAITAEKLSATASAASFPHRDQLDKLVELGLAKPEQIEQTVLDALIDHNDSSISTALIKLAETLSEDGIRQAKDRLLEKFHEPVPEDEAYKEQQALDAIVRSRLFTKDELRDVFESRLGGGQGSQLISHIDAVAETLTADQTKDLLRQAAAEGTAHKALFKSTLKGVLKNLDLEPETVFELAKQSVLVPFYSSPKDALEFVELLPPSMRPTLIREVTEKCALAKVLYEESYNYEQQGNFQWLPYLGSRGDAVEFLRDRIDRAHGFDFAAQALYWRSDKNYLQLELFTSSEVRAMVQDRIHGVDEEGNYEYTAYEIFNNHSLISAVIQDREEMADLIRQRAIETPGALFDNWQPAFSDYFTPEEVMDLLEAQWPKDMTEPPRVREKLEAYLPQDRLIELYSTHIALCDTEEDISLGIDELIDQMDDQTAQLFIQKLLDKNPYRLLESTYAAERLNTTMEDFRQWIDQYTGSFAPKTLAKINRRLDRATPYQKRLLDKDKDDLYQAFAWINQAGLVDTFDRLSQGAKSEKTERELLHLLSAVARQHAWYEQAPLDEVANLKDLRILVEDVTLSELGIGKLTTEQRTNFRKHVTDILPFAVYTSRYAESEQHRTLLKDMLSSTTTPDGYASWRFALDTPLEQLKSLGWVPSGLTTEQLQLWQTDHGEVITLGEARNDAVGTDIAELIRQNREHLGIEEKLDDPDMQARLDQLVRNLGYELKEAHAKRKQGTGNDKADEIKGWLGEAKYLRAVHLLQYADHFSAPQIKQVLRDFKAGLPEDGRFLSDRVEEMLAFAGNTLENVSITDTSDPQITIEVGAKPVPSCQHYANGSMNHDLLGYFDIDTKPVVIRGKDGNIAARAIMRLLGTETGEPVLYLEPSYTSYSQSQVDQAMNEFLAQKAGKLGIAYITDQQADIDNEEVAVYSNGSRAPGRYSDSLYETDHEGYSYAIGTTVDSAVVVQTRQKNVSD